MGQPIFPGDSGVDQLVEIIKILGTPTREQIVEMNPNYTEFKFPQIVSHPWHKVRLSLYLPPDCNLDSFIGAGLMSRTPPHTCHDPVCCVSLSFSFLFTYWWGKWAVLLLNTVLIFWFMTCKAVNKTDTKSLGQKKLLLEISNHALCFVLLFCVWNDGKELNWRSIYCLHCKEHSLVDSLRQVLLKCQHLLLHEWSH